MRETECVRGRKGRGTKPLEHGAPWWRGPYALGRSQFPGESKEGGEEGECGIGREGRGRRIKRGIEKVEAVGCTIGTVWVEWPVVASLYGWAKLVVQLGVQ